MISTKVWVALVYVNYSNMWLVKFNTTSHFQYTPLVIIHLIPLWAYLLLSYLTKLLNTNTKTVSYTTLTNFCYTLNPTCSLYMLLTSIFYYNLASTHQAYTILFTCQFNTFRCYCQDWGWMFWYLVHMFWNHQHYQKLGYCGQRFLLLYNYSVIWDCTESGQVGIYPNEVLNKFRHMTTSMGTPSSATFKIATTYTTGCIMGR